MRDVPPVQPPEPGLPAQRVDKAGKLPSCLTFRLFCCFTPYVSRRSSQPLSFGEKGTLFTQRSWVLSPSSVTGLEGAVRIM